jgi:urea-proton symporter
MQTTLLSTATGYWLIGLFGVAIFLIAYFFSGMKGLSTREGFLVADRKVDWWIGGPSIAAAWVWAGALFVSVQMAYEKGLPGIFWFTFPNVIALAIFAYLGPKIRHKFPKGFTLPQYIRDRLQSEKVHKVYLVPFFFGQLIGITFNVFAGGALLSAISGVSIVIVMPILALFVLAYTLISGLKATIVTDFVQVILLLSAILIIVPWTLGAAGGFSALAGGLAGVSGQFGNIFNPAVAFSFGIATSIGLISQTITDQQYWQRTFAIKEHEISIAFLFGAVLFAIVPLALSLLGFLAANPALHVALPAGVDSSMIGTLTVYSVLHSKVALIFFVVALLSVLSSTVDSALVAAGSLWATDVMKHDDREKNALMKYGRGETLTAGEERLVLERDRDAVRASRWTMVGMTVLGVGLAYVAHYVAGFGMSQLFLVSISIAASISVPTVLSLYWERLSARGVFWGILIAIVVGMPLFFYANTIKNDVLIVASSLFMVGVSTLLCLVFPGERIVYGEQK